MIARDGTALHGWWLTGRGDQVLVWYHGNAGNISDRLDNASMLIRRLGVDVVLVDYRGYGASQGDPNEAGLYLDGLAVYDLVAARGVPPERIVLFGRSLGAAVAVHVALERPAAGLILESPFLSVRAMARAQYPFLPTRLIRTRFDNEAKIGGVTIPTLLLHGERDRVVPYAHGRTLSERASPPTRFFTIEGAGHNDTVSIGGEPYVEAWATFLHELPPSEPRAGVPSGT